MIEKRPIPDQLREIASRLNRLATWTDVPSPELLASSLSLTMIAEDLETKEPEWWPSQSSVEALDDVVNHETNDREVREALQEAFRLDHIIQLAIRTRDELNKMEYPNWVTIKDCSEDLAEAVTRAGL